MVYFYIFLLAPGVITVIYNFW